MYTAHKCLETYKKLNRTTDIVKKSMAQIGAYANYCATKGNFKFTWAFEEYEKPYVGHIILAIEKMGYVTTWVQVHPDDPKKDLLITVPVNVEAIMVNF